MRRFSLRPISTPPTAGDEAIKILKTVTTEDPKDLEAIMALGNIERGRKSCRLRRDSTRWASTHCRRTTTRAKQRVLLLPAAFAEERSKQWSKAEADMRKALELQPEQHHVLNYLGYSWIDQGINLDEAMKMIKRAVEQAPGPTVTSWISLGWGLLPHRQNYEDRVKHLERAIDLKPEDPTINDHLGDAYWRIGRTLEAKFQWAHARDLKPRAGRIAQDRSQA